MIPASARIERVRKAMERAMEATKNYNKFFLNFAIAYGGQEEITDAIRKLADKIAGGALKPEEINEALIKQSLYTNGQPYPDIIIRTGGERRLSNFMLWQSAYSELAFVDKMWPEFSKEDFLGVMKDYQSRERRFGK
jgi:tritrans,polycis-undecaprenyl-diphosphate synthase [geranylgeranyl-diphosphate specific]